MGVFVAGIEVLSAESLEGAQGVLSAAMRALATLTIGASGPFSDPHIIVTCRIVHGSSSGIIGSLAGGGGGKKTRKNGRVHSSGSVFNGGATVSAVSFYNLASFWCPDVVTHADDRLSNASVQHLSTRQLRDAGRNFQPGAMLSQLDVRQSALTWLLQDNLFVRPDSFIIGCLRGMKGCHGENVSTCDFLNRMDVLSDDTVNPLISTKCSQLIKALQAEQEASESTVRQYEEDEVEFEAAEAVFLEFERQQNGGQVSPSASKAHAERAARPSIHFPDPSPSMEIWREMATALSKFLDILKSPGEAVDSSEKKIMALQEWLHSLGHPPVRKQAVFWTKAYMSPGTYLIPCMGRTLAAHFGGWEISKGLTLVSTLPLRATSGPERDAFARMGTIDYSAYANLPKAAETPSILAGLGTLPSHTDGSVPSLVVEHDPLGLVTEPRDNLKIALSMHMQEEDDVDDDSFNRLLESTAGEVAERGMMARGLKPRNQLYSHFALDGPGVLVEHAVLYYEGALEVDIRPVLRPNNTPSYLTVNGAPVTAEKTLKDGDFLTIGPSRMFRLRIVEAQRDDGGDDDDAESLYSAASPNTLGSRSRAASSASAGAGAATAVGVAVSGLTYKEEFGRIHAGPIILEQVRNVLSEGRHASHMNVDRVHASATSATKKTSEMKLESYTPSTRETRQVVTAVGEIALGRMGILVSACQSASYMGALLDKNTDARLFFKELSAAEARRERRLSGCIHFAIGAKDFSAHVLFRIVDDGEEIALWTWSAIVVAERYSLMLRIFHCYQSECDSDLEALEIVCPPEDDPFLDIPENELVGVSYLYLDPFQYMMDIHEQLPIVNFKGAMCGSLKVSGRVWIDAVTVESPFCNADDEMRIENYFNRTAHMRFHVLNVVGVPPKLCCKMHTEFKFFFHANRYRSPDHFGFAANPFLNWVAPISQKITPDFLDYLQNGSIEIEVWGRRVNPLSVKEAQRHPSRFTRRVGRIGEDAFTPKPKRVPGDPNGPGAEEESDDETALLGEDDPDPMVELQEEVANLRAELERTTRKLERSEKMTAKLEKSGRRGGGWMGKKSPNDAKGETSSGCCLIS
jgi:hypothetical protein